MREVNSLHDKLAAVPAESPRVARKKMVGAIREEISSHFGMFFRCVRDADGGLVYTDGVFQGDTEMEATLAPYLGSPATAVRTPWWPSEVDQGEIDAFIRTRHFYDDEELFSYEAQKKLLRPLEVGEHLRAVFYEGGKLLGWIGLIRRGGDERFTAEEARRLQRVAGPLKAAIAGTNAVQSEHLERQVSGIFSPDGRLEHATEAFVDWLTPTLEDYLARWVRLADVGRDGNEIGVQYPAGSEVRLARMNGRDGVRYLATADPADPAERTVASQLTDRQFEIAEYVRAGAAAREIAETLGISDNTVYEHLQNIYQRLGIGTRAELASRMARCDRAD